jgi:predicted metal-binding protein
MGGEIVRVGMIMCNRYHTCAAGKCLRAMRNREGAFSIYAGKEVELVGCTTCGGCPGGNIEYAPAEMKKNGVTVIHLATGMLVGYPPCTRIDYFRRFIREQYGIPVVVGTHPIPQKYFKIHDPLGSWRSPLWQELIQPTLATEEIRLAYD